MGRVAALLLLAAVAVVSGAVITRHPRTISALDVASGERVTSFIVVFHRLGTYGIGGKAVPLTRHTLDMYLVERLPSFSLFNARQSSDQFIYNSGEFVGFSAMLSKSEVTILAADPEVAYIEEDSIMELDHLQRAGPSFEIDAKIELDWPTWGTDRSDQRALPLDKVYKLAITKDEIVAVPNVYVVDTGVNVKHVEFEGRAVLAKSFFTDGKDDCNGHGSHVAATVAGVNVGIAPFANILGVRVLDCRGSTSYARLISAIDWVVKNHVKPAILQMSLGGGKSQAINDVTAAAIDAGVTATLASGNSADDACFYSPASTPGAITVNSMNSTAGDRHTYFSNYGECTVIYAPGEHVISAWIGTPNTYFNASGTSMATPHVAGAAAIFLARKPNATPEQVLNAMICASTKDKLDLVPDDTPNRLFYLEAATMKACLP